VVAQRVAVLPQVQEQEQAAVRQAEAVELAQGLKAMQRAGVLVQELTDWSCHYSLLAQLRREMVLEQPEVKPEHSFPPLAADDWLERLPGRQRVELEQESLNHRLWLVL
jgi:hypothetical protein